jgi:hypothetical protein
MNLAVYIIAKLMLLLLVFGLLSTMRFAIRQTFLRMQVPLAQQQKYLRWLLLGILLWLAFLAVLALSGLLSNFQSGSPPLLLYILFPPLIFSWGLLFWPPFQKFLKNVPKTWLFYGQTYRILTDVVLWLGFYGGFVPKQLTFLWLNQDYTVGLTAIVAGTIFFSKGQNRKFEATLWNVFGIILLFNQVFLGYISLPFSTPILDTGISSLFLTDFPFVWLWGFTIPFGFALHTASIFQIHTAGKATKRRKFSLNKNRLRKK